MGNHLNHESSPYLLQHAAHPVDWYPWGTQAFERARLEDKPVFLSIGYSSCHWCHVMAHESFEDKEIADILNQNYISVKVDREERPDIDSVYMSVCQAVTGSGGWPMSIFMTAQQMPFYAGTYFPPDSRYGRVGFKDLLLRIAKLWHTDKRGLLESSEIILDRLGNDMRPDRNEYCDGGTGESGLPQLAAAQFRESFDPVYGGFGSAPKFPAPHNLLFLILYAQITGEDTLAMAELTLLQMRRGGMFDHIGFGFSRYSTDRFYLVPHFEKMLYDNALLIIAYACGYKAAKKSVFLDTAEKTAAYVLREMRSGEGAFYSAQDADSEGAEGRYYVFDYDEILRVLGRKRGRAFCEHYGVTRQGNFEGRNILNLLGTDEICERFEEERRLLYEYRMGRAQLYLDDKVLTAWNSLMICALSVLYRVSGKEKYLSSAEDACRFIEEKLSDGAALFVSFRAGRHSAPGFLDDYAYFAAALLALYDATLDPSYLARAEEICDEAQRQFADENGGYFLYGTKNDELIIRPKETYDGALPSGNAVMAYNLVRLAQTGDKRYRRRADRQLAFLSREAKDYPAGHTMFLIALLCDRYPPMDVTVVPGREDRGKPAGELLARLPLCARVRVLAAENEEYRLLNEKTTYYVCRGQVCLPPANDVPGGTV